MPAPSSLSLPLVLALAVTASAIGVLAWLTHAFARRHRGHAREREREVASALQRFLAGSLTVLELRASLRAIEADAFWAALERLPARIKRERWLALSKALERSRHAASERRSLRDDSPWRRELAARRLGLLRSKRTRRALRRALRRGPELVAFAAAHSLAHDRDLASLAWLLEHPELFAHRPPTRRAALLSAFGSRALPALAFALARGTAAGWERAVIEALGHGRYAFAREAVERALASHDSELRVAAARSLGRLGVMQSAVALTSALEDDAWPVRAQAARSLGLLGNRGAIPALAARLTDRSWWVRRHAAYALASLGEDGARALQSAAASSPDRYAREMACEALEAVARRSLA